MSFIEFSAGSTISAVDPGFQSDTSAPVEQFASTVGTGKGQAPNRFTILVPSEHVTLNMGQAVLPTTGDPIPSGAPKTQVALVDAGYVVQTDNHIHFHTFGATTQNTSGNPPPNPLPTPDERTLVRLGIPSRTITAVADKYGDTSGERAGNSLQTPVYIGSVWPDAFNTWNGYSMVTEGYSYIESQNSSAVVSGAQDLRLAGNTSVLVGSPGKVHIAADNSAAVRDFANNSDWTTHNATEDAIYMGLNIVNIGLSAGFGLLLPFITTYGRSPTAGYVGWKAFGGFGDWATIAITTLGVGLQVYATATQDAPESAGDISLYAADSLKAYATLTTSVHSGLATSISADLITSVSGPFIMSVASDVITSVSSNVAVSVSGIFSAGISSALGSVSVKGKSSVELSSFGDVYVTAKDNLQVNSTDKSLYLHGAQSFYLGTGAGKRIDPTSWFSIAEIAYSPSPSPGWGIAGDKDGLKLGKMNAANAFTNPLPNAPQILVQDAQLQLLYGPDNALTLDANGAAVNGKRIQLGGPVASTSNPGTTKAPSTSGGAGGKQTT